MKAEIKKIVKLNEIRLDGDIYESTHGEWFHAHPLLLSFIKNVVKERQL